MLFVLFFFRSSTEPRYKKAFSRFIFSGDDVLPKVNGRAGIFLMIYKIHRRGGGGGGWEELLEDLVVLR